MKNVFASEVRKKDITRICHFTKSKNLIHILREFNGIMATNQIPDSYKDINDNQRLDGKPNYVCCSIQYPNLFYLDRIKDRDILFKDWIVLCIDPAIISERKTLFSPVNAATERGKYIVEGMEGFKSLYNNEICTSKRSLSRSEEMLKSCTTDAQAEVLICDNIPKEYIKGIIVQNEEQARKEFTKLKLLNIGQDIDIIVSKDVFDKNIYNKIRNGNLPMEKLWNKVLS